MLSPFLQPYLEAGLVNEEQVGTVYRIVDSVSWSKEEARRERIKQDGASTDDERQMDWEQSCAEFKCVSDADRLDAIGSIGEEFVMLGTAAQTCRSHRVCSASLTGILRVAAFSAAKSRPLHIPPANPANDSVPPAEQGQGYNASAIAHFHTK